MRLIVVFENGYHKFFNLNKFKNVDYFIHTLFNLNYRSTITISLSNEKENKMVFLMQTILYSIHTRLTLNIITKSIGCFNIYLKPYYSKWRFDI